MGRVEAAGAPQHFLITLQKSSGRSIRKKRSNKKYNAGRSRENDIMSTNVAATTVVVVAHNYQAQPGKQKTPSLPARTQPVTVRVIIRLNAERERERAERTLARSTMTGPAAPASVCECATRAPRCFFLFSHFVRCCVCWLRRFTVTRSLLLARAGFWGFAFHLPALFYHTLSLSRRSLLRCARVCVW